MGYTNVFPHVGRNTQIRSPSGRPVYPLITGSFGGADFIHSLMGEAGDKLSSVRSYPFYVRELMTGRRV